MKLSLDINTSRFSFRFIGGVALGLSALLLALSLPWRVFFLPALALLAAGLALFGRGFEFLIRHDSADVAEQITRTLKLMGWQHSREDDIINVPALKAAIRVQPLASATLLSFDFAGKVAKREQYLINTLVKFQRQTKAVKE